MWPWSAIRTARRDAESFAKKCGELNVLLERQRQAWSTLNENYEEVLRLHNAAKVHFDQQNDTVARQAHQIETLNAEKQIALREVARLRRQLAEATKNDARDPKTGRFVKSVGGSASGDVGAQEHSTVLRAAGVPYEGDGQEHGDVMRAIRGDY